jgi:hypothetical protein
MNKSNLDLYAARLSDLGLISDTASFIDEFEEREAEREVIRNTERRFECYRQEAEMCK